MTESKRSVAVILLASGYAPTLTNQLLAVSDNPLCRTKTRQATWKNILVRGPVGGSKRVCTGMAPLNGQPAITYLLYVLKKCERLFPIQDNTYIVCNGCDRVLFDGENGLLEHLAGDTPLDASHILHNSSLGPDDYRGQVADIQMALNHIKDHGYSHALIIGCDMVLMPDYNMTRVIEHCIIRSKDIMGYTHLRTADVRCLGSQGHARVRQAEPNQVPRLSGIDLDCSAAVGDSVAEPLAMLRASSWPTLMQSGAFSLVEFMRDMASSGQHVCGVDLGFGRLRLTTYGALDYADRYILYSYRKRKDENKRLGLASAIALKLPEDETDFSLAATAWTMRTQVMEEVKACPQDPTAEFDTLFFSELENLERGLDGSAFYKLPPNFYMTEYRRQAGAMLR